MTRTAALGWLVAAWAVALVLVAIEAAGLGLLSPLRAVAGAFLALVAPGAALLAAVRPPFLAGSARAVLAVPVSLGMLAVLGVVLDRTPAGVTPGSMAVASWIVTGVLLAVAAARAVRARTPAAGVAP